MKPLLRNRHVIGGFPLEKKFDTRPLIFLVLACILALSLITRQPPEQGWANQRGGIAYYRDGQVLTGWQKLDNQIYYFGTDGLLLTGWQEIDDSTYYLGSDGSMRSGWLELGDVRYYFGTDGSLRTGRQNIDGSEYFFRPDGSLASGIVEEKGVTYLFSHDGLIQNGWLQLDGKSYYGDESGRTVSGWVEIENKKHYFDDTGAAVSGWVELDGFTHYFHADGSPAQGEEMIGGKVHHFASNGQKIILVNPWHALPEDYTVELTPISDTHQIASIAYEDYWDMMSDCIASGLEPAVCSAYRTQEYQEKLYTNRLNRYVWAGYPEEEAAVLAGQSVAVPGTSEHQLGLALDIVDDNNWALNETQANMPAQKWLMENSWRYGWILRYPSEKSEITGIIYEPWHYRYVGRTIAKEIYDLGICLEEYLQMLTNSVG